MNLRDLPLTKRGWAVLALVWSLLLVAVQWLPLLPWE